MRNRLVVLSSAGVVLFSLLIIRFYFLQVIQGEYWSQRADRQHYFTIQEPFRRGTFYSNATVKKKHPGSPRPIVLDVQKFHLHADPQSIGEDVRFEVIAALYEKLDIPPHELISFTEQFEKKSRDRLLAMWIDPELKEEIAGWWRPFAKQKGLPQNALFFESDYRRSYPFGKMLGQVLHTVQNRRDETTKQATPTGGLELSLSPYLQGKLGRRKLMRSPRHSMELGEVEEAPEDGADVYLTINHCLQAIAEDALAKGVRKAKAKRGTAVIMNPHTGEILALAQVPFFHPSDYQSYFNDPEKTDDTRLSALGDVSEPGSIMKPLTMVAALMANEELKARGKPPVFDPEKKVRSDDGSLPGRKQPMTDVGAHRYLNMAMALQKSSNIYMARTIHDVVSAMGCNWYRKVLTDVFGFGEPTGVEFPAENPGMIPTPGRLYPNGKLEWSVPTPYSLAIGYNFQANDIQMLRAWSLLANGGKKVCPTLIRKIVKGDRVLVDHTGRGRTRPYPQVVDPEIIARVKEAVRYNTMPGGTGKRANIPGYTQVGKSRTSRKLINGQYSTKKHTVGFIGFAPAEDPEFICLVTIDEPAVFYIPGVGHNNHGGIAAAPIFREIGRKTLEYLGVPPDDPFGYPKGDPRRNPEKAVFEKETRLLIEKYDSWNK